MDGCGRLLSDSSRVGEGIDIGYYRDLTYLKTEVQLGGGFQLCLYLGSDHHCYL
jgi:hypothetical protein